LLLLRPPHSVGHNPTGALMVFALRGVVFAIVATGLLVLGGEEKQDPLVAVIGSAVGFAAKHVHAWLVLLLLALVTCHVAGAGAVRPSPTCEPAPGGSGQQPGASYRQLAAVLAWAPPCTLHPLLGLLWTLSGSRDHQRPQRRRGAWLGRRLARAGRARGRVLFRMLVLARFLLFKRHKSA
jgi:hypothetical protein